jgi:hypothetical protein
MCIFKILINNKVWNNRLNNHIIHSKKCFVGCTWFRTFPPMFNVILDNKIKCLSLVIFSSNPTKKIVIKTTCMWELLIANHLDQSLWLTNQKYRAIIKFNLLHFFLEVHNYVAPLTNHNKLHKFGVKKSISWTKPTHFNFFTIKFII